MTPPCPECGRKTDTYMGFGTTTGRDHWYCKHCNKIQPLPDRHERQEADDTEDDAGGNSPLD